MVANNDNKLRGLRKLRNPDRNYATQKRDETKEGKPGYKNNLKNRLKSYLEMNHDKLPTKYHKPGSNKK